MSTALSLVSGVLVVFALTALTGYFVAQEFAYMAVDRARLASRARQGDEQATRTLDITRRTSFMLSGAQLGITVTGLLVGYVAEPLIGVALAEALGSTMSAGLALAIGSVIALFLSTVIQMLFGELFPKNYAVARAEPVARRLSRSTRLYLAVFGPLIWVFDKSSELLLRALGIRPVHDVDQTATARDLEHVVERSRDAGDLTSELSTMLDRILDFPERTVEHAMIPRARVDILRESTTLEETRSLMASGHTRYPLLSEQDEILGVIHLLDVLCAAEGSDSLSPVAYLARPPVVLSELTSLPDALAELDRRGEQLACVVDEYGGFAGILTIEDLAEEIVGEITDEHDPDEPDYVPQPDDGTWVMGGDVHIDEVERALRVDLPRGDYETIAGLVIEQHGGLPEEGLHLRIELPIDPAELARDIEPQARVLDVDVLAIDNYVPSRLRLTLPDEQLPGGQVDR